MERRNYHVALVGYEPEQTIKGTNKQARIYFKKDTIHFLTRQEQMEFVDNNDQIVERIKNSEVLKMLLARDKQGRLVNPIVELMLYYQGESGGRIYFDETREIDVGLGRFMKRTTDGRGYSVESHRSDIAAMPGLFKK